MESSESALNEFFSECDEILQRFSATLSLAEKSEASHPETIGALYRDMHTLKGSAQLFGFRLIAQVAHAMEASLEPIRRLNLKIPPQLVDALFKSIDLIDRVVKESSSLKKEAGGELELEVRATVPKLLSVASDHFGGELEAFKDQTGPVVEDRVVGQAMPIKYKTASPDKVFSPASEKQVGGSLVQQNPMNAIEDAGHTAADTPTKELHKEPADAAGVEANSTVRINVNLLDKLMNLVGEMVLVRNQMLQYGQKHDALEFHNLSQRLDVVTSDLQGDVMKTRMQPIGSVLSKFQRLIRDLAKDLGKQIELTLHGTETELDKTLLEAIKDPLTHIIRNSCDHGLETPADRLSAGKSAIGHIHVRSFHEGGHVIIEVRDDGRGLDLKRILAKAIEKKILTQEQATKLSNHEIAHLIFAPGFSTAENVTSVSGRGVGMDVVRTNLEKIGGQVELQNDYGRGMSVRLRIPLTLAIVPALIIRACGEQFAIPQVKLAELVRVEREGGGPKIESLQGKPVFRLRGQLLPLIDLREILALELKARPVLSSDSINIVVLNGDGESFGLIVDEIKDTADIVVKPLSNFLKKLQVYSGATIMGDGSVSLILDVAGLAQKGHLFQKTARKEIIPESALAAKGSRSLLENQDFLFFKLNSKESYCLPLCLVHRLEEFSAREIQYSGLQRMVKYRDSILPIISLNDFFGMKADMAAADGESESVSLVVVQRRARLLGVQVNKVVDIINVAGTIEEAVKETNGILGSLIVDKDVVTVIDVFAILDSVAGINESRKSTGGPTQSRATEVRSPAHILFAEDTVFFVKQVKKLLESNGYIITHAADGAQAWEILSTSPPGSFKLVLSDIEMPKMTGYELAERVRADSRFASTPMIALTTRFREADLEKGRTVGFNRYLEKLRSDELVETVREILGGQASG